MSDPSASSGQALKLRPPKEESLASRPGRDRFQAVLQEERALAPVRHAGRIDGVDIWGKDSQGISCGQYINYILERHNLSSCVRKLVEIGAR
jgi:hypothetical protein